MAKDIDQMQEGTVLTVLDALKHYSPFIGNDATSRSLTQINNELCRFVITMAVQNSDLVDTPFLISFLHRYVQTNKQTMQIPSSLRTEFYALIEQKMTESNAME